RTWSEDLYFDPKTRDQVKNLLNSIQELESAFFTELKFGTGGLRGIMGVGTARINIYTIRKATQGLATYLKKHGDPTKGVVIGFDSRHNSELFAHETARVLIGNQIQVFLCHTLRPTPFISFACRHLSAAAAIMITASHNPKEYNGYKVYWDDGAQIVSPHDRGIIQEIEKIPSYSDVKLANLNSPLLSWVDETLDTTYLQAISSHPIFSSKQKKDLKICYSSLHGTGITLLPKALQACGFLDPLLVASQCKIDANFSSVSSPNPESPATLQEGIKLLKQSKSDLFLVTDPDADRLGVVINHYGKPVILNGHQLAVLGAFYLCNTLSQKQLLPKKSGIVTTIVTTPLIDKIAKAYKVKTTRVLTGFKYIGEKIREWGTKDSSFLFGAEESFGYLIGTSCRDKDGIAAACLFAEIGANLKSQGKTLLDLLYEIYRRFGVFQEKSFSLTVSHGKKGVETLRHLMQELRNHPPTTLGDQTVIQSIDYLQKVASLPRADVLEWILEDGSTLIMRPSGTEPKLKAYLSTYRPSGGSIESVIKECQVNLDKLTCILQNHLENYTKAFSGDR
ncbi:MAG: phospho-sugar mutase, partial [Rhabdochlamydiaceae bacterium]